MRENSPTRVSGSVSNPTTPTRTHGLSPSGAMWPTALEEHSMWPPDAYQSSNDLFHLSEPMNHLFEGSHDHDSGGGFATHHGDLPSLPDLMDLRPAPHVPSLAFGDSGENRGRAEMCIEPPEGQKLPFTSNLLLRTPTSTTFGAAGGLDAYRPQEAGLGQVSPHHQHEHSPQHHHHPQIPLYSSSPSPDTFNAEGPGDCFAQDASMLSEGARTPSEWNEILDMKRDVEHIMMRFKEGMLNAPQRHDSKILSSQAPPTQALPESSPDTTFIPPPTRVHSTSPSMRAFPTNYNPVEHMDHTLRRVQSAIDEGDGDAWSDGSDTGTYVSRQTIAGGTDPETHKRTRNRDRARRSRERKRMYVHEVETKVKVLSAENAALEQMAQALRAENALFEQRIAELKAFFDANMDLLRRRAGEGGGGGGGSSDGKGMDKREQTREGMELRDPEKVGTEPGGSTNSLSTVASG